MKIIHTDNPNIDIITKEYVDIDNLTIPELLEYIELEEKLFIMERQKKRAQRQNLNLYNKKYINRNSKKPIHLLRGLWNLIK